MDFGVVMRNKSWLIQITATFVNVMPMDFLCAEDYKQEKIKVYKSKWNIK
jgi:hypothetical protein